MSKVKIKLTFLGHVPITINISKIEKWKSDLFELILPIDYYRVTENADGSNWQFTDDCLSRQLPENFDADILVAVTNIPIENNYYARRVSNNRICLTFHEMSDILNFYNIPLENLILRVLYSSSLIYKRYGNRFPESSEITRFTHDETRGCLFDMNGIKTEIIYSTNKPQLCSSCLETLTKEKIQTNLLAKVQKELKRIKKSFFYQISDFIKAYPIWTLIITGLSAITLGLIGSLLASLIYDSIF